MEEFDIYILSFLQNREHTPEAGLQRAFGLDERRAREFVQSLPRVVKRNVSSEHVARYERVLRELGANFELRRSAIRPAQVIAVQGGARAAPAPDPAQHGGTLTLTLPPPSPSPSSSQFAATLVDPGPPAALVAELARAQAQSPFVQPAAERLPDPFGRAPSARPPRAVERLATLREGDLSSIPVSLQEPWNAPTERPPAAPVPAPARAPISVPPADPMVASTWGSLPFAPALPTPAKGVWAPIPLTPLAASIELDDDLPPAGKVPGLSLDGRPDWLVSGSRAFREADTAALPGAAPAAHSTRAPAVTALELDGAPPQPLPGGRGQPARLPAEPAPRRPGPLDFVVTRAPEVESPLVLKIAVRVGAGLALFVIVTALRIALDSDVKTALAKWNEPAAATTARAPNPRALEGRLAYGPSALGWLESDLHQVTNGDKDRVRGLAQAYKAAGAVEVYMGTVMSTGPVQLAGELIIELPADAATRKAVHAEHARALAASFGGFAPAVTDTGAPVLRLTL